MPLAAFSRHVMVSLSKHLRPFGYAQGDRMGQSKDPEFPLLTIDSSSVQCYSGARRIMRYRIELCLRSVR